MTVKAGFVRKESLLFLPSFFNWNLTGQALFVKMKTRKRRELEKAKQGHLF
jgi:hypothetical protein